MSLPIALMDEINRCRAGSWHAGTLDRPMRAGSQQLDAVPSSYIIDAVAP
jgi:hypothetical protein